ncbi:MAG: hypothetical protein IT379_01100 [Deltaproteobacteria bacterium]|nr:hypothetical protein [Deltaproteobacteria bacterium]
MTTCRGIVAAFAAAIAGLLLGAAAIAHACDPAGRIDLFGLADAAPLVVVGTTDDRRHVSVLHVLKGARPARGLRLVLPGGNCAPAIEAGRPYVLFLRPNGSMVGAFESAHPLHGAATAAATSRAEIVIALRSWLGQRDRNRRRRLLIELVTRVGPAAREAARTLSTARAWAHVAGHSLGDPTAEECARLRTARGLPDTTWPDRAATLERQLEACTAPRADAGSPHRTDR